jgi:hypothetical protein
VKSSINTGVVYPAATACGGGAAAMVKLLAVTDRSRKCDQRQIHHFASVVNIKLNSLRYDYFRVEEPVRDHSLVLQMLTPDR